MPPHWSFAPNDTVTTGLYHPLIHIDFRPEGSDGNR